MPKKNNVLTVKRLIAERLRIRAQVVVCKEQRVKGDLAKFQIAHRHVPSRFGALVKADVKRAKRRLELIGDKLLERVDH